MTTQASFSTAHALFLSSVDREALSEQGWLLRRGVQFHWAQRTIEPWLDFEDFLASMQGPKRKKILQERRRVREAGVSFLVLEGKAIEDVHWDYFYRCYLGTYQAHLSQPYLTRTFFRSMALHMAEHWLMFVAEKDGAWVGASLIAIDPSTGRAWGRYWGSTEPIDCLHFEACYYQPLQWCIENAYTRFEGGAQGEHFEACYYQPLQWCIENAYTRFEGGAQGEHKMARGLMPTETWSAHWCPQPAFRSAIAEFLAREREGVADYETQLLDHSPFKTHAESS
jgi:predicted N-acyltransferase